jgi:AMP nucleosidase
LTDSLHIRKQAASDPAAVDALIVEACDLMERIYAGGRYPLLTVERSWSRHNPAITGEMARPSAYRWYLLRELRKLVLRGAEVQVESSRPRVQLKDPALFRAIDEHDWDITRKKLFLFAPERCELSMERLEHYTGTRAEDFQRSILLTNYRMHMDAFARAFPGCIRPAAEVQMPAYHHRQDENRGFTIINIGVGPSNAKNCTDQVAVLRPDAMLMVGHCGGIRNHQEVGDFVLASGYMRADRVLDAALPAAVPVAPSFVLNRYLARVLDEEGLPYRIGTVYTTADRNWEFSLAGTLNDLRVSRSIAIDMESATVAANGFRYRIPNATLLCVSDRPLHGAPKLPGAAREFYQVSQEKHIRVAVRALELARNDWPEGLPTASIRALDEPLMGGPED